MELAEYQMKQGIAEKQAYHNFGKHCGLQAYRKLASLLEQNLEKGTSGLSVRLFEEMRQAFEERKSFAIRKGEEATTKLLLPMFLMLAIVLVICIVPAVMSFQGI
jgi:argininosuccinate lyase